MTRSKERVISIILLVTALLCGCASSNGVDSGSKSSEVPESAASLLAIEPGYERRAVKMDLSDFDGAIDAAILCDDKLWLVSEQTLYTANPDGSDARELFGGVPDNTQYITFGADGDVYFGSVDDVSVYSKDGEYKSQFALERSGTNQLQAIFDLVTPPDGDPIALIWSEREGGLTLSMTSAAFGDAVDYGLPPSVDVLGTSY